MINIDRMIGRVAALADDANRAFGISGGGEKNFLKQQKKQQGLFYSTNLKNIFQTASEFLFMIILKI